MELFFFFGILPQFIWLIWPTLPPNNLLSLLDEKIFPKSKAFYSSRQRGIVTDLTTQSLVKITLPLWMVSFNLSTIPPKL